MKRLVISFVAILMLIGLAQSSEAQWARRYYRPVVVAPRPKTRVYRAPVVIYQPGTVIYARRRPLLGGTVVRTRPGYRRVVF